ncbi:MAG TPA: phosphomannomutase/phosphoglucomutase [Clostridia bacterium]|nr:phosphomannomutase/phosphoglucomutase [Clostridia bacterium]
MADLLKLQNGSDIRGTAIPLEGGKAADLTDEAARAIGGAFAAWLSARLGKPAEELRVAVGRDSRLSGEALLESLSTGLSGVGARVADLGLATTPAMFMATVSEGYLYDGTVMITASHLPFEKNGFKFFTREGGLDKKDISALLSRAQSGEYPIGRAAAVYEADFMGEYARILRHKIIDGAKLGKLPLEGLRIVVDAGNGAGGFFAAEVLEPLGADTRRSLFLKPDGRFPNHAPNPEDERAMAFITGAVLETGADLGIIFDTDVDRAGAVLPDGRELNRNRLIAMIAAIALRDHPGTTIVTDSITSTGLARFIRFRGGIHRRFKRGYKNVIDEAIRLNAAGQDAEVAMETSGHGALRENYFLDDGAYLMVKLVIELARAKRGGHALSHLIDGLAEPCESREYRMALVGDDFAQYGKKILDDLAEYVASVKGFSVAPDNFEGLRADADASHGDGWFLLRMSLHEPLMPLNIESDSEGGLELMARVLYAFLSRYDRLDTSPLAQDVE